MNYVKANDGFYYYVDQEETTWAEARERCASSMVGARLAIVDTEATFEAVKEAFSDQIRSNGGQGAWLSASDKDEEGRWQWIVKEGIEEIMIPLTNGFTRWADGEPRNKNKNCLLWARSGWKDFRCEQKRPSLCQFPYSGWFSMEFDRNASKMCFKTSISARYRIG